MKKTRTKPSKKLTSVTPTCELILEVGGKMYSSSGDTMLETLQSLPKPAKIFAKGALTVRCKGKERVRAMVIPQIKRLYYPLAQKIVAKQLATGF